jgi:hypothetical protein
MQLTAADSVDFVKFLAAEAGKRGMATGLKNAGNIIPQVLSVVQFSVNEQCSEMKECDTFSSFINANKPVYHIEYPTEDPEPVTQEALDKACKSTGSSLFSTVVKTQKLDGWVEFCNGQTATTAVRS